MSCHSGIRITGGDVGTSVMGDRSDYVQASNVLDDYSFIHLNANEENGGLIFRCVTGLGPSGSNSNNVIGDIFYNDNLLNASTNSCNGFVRVTGAKLVDNLPGVYNARVCEDFKFTTSEEGVYTCRLLNSNMMYQNMSIGLYFRGRSKLQILCND